MTEATNDLIIVAREELEDPSIDEALLRQRMAGPSALVPIEENRWRRVFYSNWCYLALAGALGALAAHAVIEPHYSDGIAFEGRINAIESSPIEGRGEVINISGVPVYLDRTAVIRSTSTSEGRLTPDDLHVDSVVKVATWPFRRDKDKADKGEKGEHANRPDLYATGVLIQTPETPVKDPIDIGAVYEADNSMNRLWFPWVASMIGLMVGSVEGLICRTASRAVRGAVFGFLAGLLCGFLMNPLADFAYEELAPAGSWTKDGATFVVQMLRRGLAWGVAGCAMGLGQGFSLKSRKLLLHGLVGGTLGGILGGMLFDPIYLLCRSDDPFDGGAMCRGIGACFIGLTVGLLIGATDLLTRSAWLRVLAGPLRGKEFSFVQTPVRLGSSPRNEIYLFKDPKIQPIHATIEKLRDTYELRDLASATGTFVNGQKAQRARLQNGDRIRIGDSEFLYTTREKRA